MVDNSTIIAHQDQIQIICDGNWPRFNNTQRFGTQEERQNPDVVDAKRSVYYYGIFIHTYSSRPGSSGCADYNNRNLVVSLGFDKIWAQEGNPPHRVGSRDQQEGTLMHELGHLLNIWHGGATRLDAYKPNYLSVMNYNFQFASPIGTRPLDYSTCLLSTLDETRLNESAGIGNDCSAGLSTWVGWHYLNGTTECEPDTLADADGTPIDYDGDNNFNETLRQDINCDKKITKLNTQNDWDNITYLNGATGDPNNISNGLRATGGNMSSIIDNHTTSDIGNNNITQTFLLDEKSAEDVEADLLRLATDLNETVNETPVTSFNVSAVPAITIANRTLDLSNATSGGAGIEDDPAQTIKEFISNIIGNPNNASAGLGTEQETLLSLMATENWDGAINVLSEISSITNGTQAGISANGTGGGISVLAEPRAQQEINRKIVNFQAVLASLRE